MSDTLTPEASALNAHSAPENSKKGRIKRFVDDFQFAVATVILALLSPFILDFWFSKYQSDLPSSWVHGWKRIRASAFCIILLCVIAYFRHKNSDGWQAFVFDGAFLIVSIKGLFLNLWDLVIFVLVPRPPGILQDAGSTFLNKFEKGFRDLIKGLGEAFFPDAKTEWVVSKLVRALIDYGFDLGRKYLQEILLRGTLVYLSMRYSLLLLFLILAFAGVYDWIRLVSGNAFVSSGPIRGLGGCIFFSVDILTTSSISGISAATNLAKSLAAMELGMGFLSLVFFIPLVFVSYDRALAMQEEIQKLQEKHILTSGAEFITAKTGLPLEDATKLLLGELEQSKIEKLGIKLEKLEKEKKEGGQAGTGTSG